MGVACTAIQCAGKVKDALKFLDIDIEGIIKDTALRKLLVIGLQKLHQLEQIILEKTGVKLTEEELEKISQKKKEEKQKLRKEIEIQRDEYNKKIRDAKQNAKNRNSTQKESCKDGMDDSDKEAKFLQINRLLKEQLDEQRDVLHDSLCIEYIRKYCLPTAHEHILNLNENSKIKCSNCENISLIECAECNYGLCADCRANYYDYKEEISYMVSPNHNGHILMRNKFADGKCSKCRKKKAAFTCTVTDCGYKLCENCAKDEEKDDFDELVLNEDGYFEVSKSVINVPNLYWTFNRFDECPMINLSLNNHFCNKCKNLDTQTLYYCNKHDYDLCEKCYKKGKY